jgi:hypothetical protein
LAREERVSVRINKIVHEQLRKLLEQLNALHELAKIVLMGATRIEIIVTREIQMAVHHGTQEIKHLLKMTSCVR